VNEAQLEQIVLAQREREDRIGDGGQQRVFFFPGAGDYDEKAVHKTITAEVPRLLAKLRVA